jgi:hypothetical protein
VIAQDARKRASFSLAWHVLKAWSDVTDLIFLPGPLYHGTHLAALQGLPRFHRQREYCNSRIQGGGNVMVRKALNLARIPASRVWRWAIGLLLTNLAVITTIWWIWSPPVVAKNPAPSGQAIFRFDTFGDEQLWTDRLRLHEVIESNIDPLTALSLGLKVDVDALPDSIRAAILSGEVDLTDPAITLALIDLNAVVGVVG